MAKIKKPVFINHKTVIKIVLKVLSQGHQEILNGTKIFFVFYIVSGRIMMPLALHLNVPRGTYCLWFNQDPQRNVPQVFTKWSEKI